MIEGRGLEEGGSSRMGEENKELKFRQYDRSALSSWMKMSLQCTQIERLQNGGVVIYCENIIVVIDLIEMLYPELCIIEMYCLVKKSHNYIHVSLQIGS